MSATGFYKEEKHMNFFFFKKKGSLVLLCVARLIKLIKKNIEGIPYNEQLDFLYEVNGTDIPMLFFFGGYFFFAVICTFCSLRMFSSR